MGSPFQQMYPQRKRFPWAWIVFAVILAGLLVWISYKPGQSAAQFLTSLVINTLTIGGLIVVPLLLARWIIHFFKESGNKR